jgi:hypothetical protein
MNICIPFERINFIINILSTRFQQFTNIVLTYYNIKSLESIFLKCRHIQKKYLEQLNLTTRTFDFYCLNDQFSLPEQLHVTTGTIVFHFWNNQFSLQEQLNFTTKTIDCHCWSNQFSLQEQLDFTTGTFDSLKRTLKRILRNTMIQTNSKKRVMVTKI